MEAVELSVVIPSRGRERILSETLRRLLEEGRGQPVEVIVSYDGDTGERRIATEMGGGDDPPLRVLDGPAAGPASARNRGLAEARGGAVLFLGDDAWPRPGLLAAHLRFHREHGAEGEAMLGLVEPAPPLDGSEFIRWLHRGGVQFGYGGLAPGPVDPTCFWTANVSAKASLLRGENGFDEAFGDAACEDAELGVRLARAGMRLVYEPAAAAEHYHPADLATTLDRMRRVGLAYRLLVERAPEVEVPSRPGARHRAKAAALLPAAALGLANEATWRFLCDEALREAYWGVEPGPGRRLHIGDAVARAAIRRQGESIPA
jgi:glycosyltransferase involved in cell wall biosynthesis